MTAAATPAGLTRPLLPPGAGPTVVAFGDSYFDNGDTTSGTTTYRSITGGWLGWFNILTGFRFWCPPENNLGIAGNTSSQMLARLPDVLALQPDIVLFNMTGNGLVTGAGSAECARYAQMFDTMIRSGAVVMAFTIAPRTSPNAFSSAGLKVAQHVNNWAREFVRSRRGIYLVDLDQDFSDPTSGTWAPRSGAQGSDGVHPSSGGAYIGANKAAGFANALFPSWRLPVMTASDAYDATDTPYGNLLGNPMLTGTNGAVDSGSVTGTDIASSGHIVAGSLGGATATVSKSTMSDGRPCQQIAISGSKTGSSRFIQFYQAVSSPGSKVAEGDVIEAGCDISVATPTNIVGAECWLWSVESGTTYFNKFGVGAGAEAIPAGGFAAPLLAPRRTMFAAPTTLINLVHIPFVDGSVSVEATIKIASTHIRRINR